MRWKEFQEVLPEKLKEYREGAGFTQEELGKRSGLSGQTIWAAESRFTTGKKYYGLRKANIQKIFRILTELEKYFEENFG